MYFSYKPYLTKGSDVLKLTIKLLCQLAAKNNLQKLTVVLLLEYVNDNNVMLTCCVLEVVMAFIGIMGGTFNPIHIGHTEIAKSAYEQYHLDEIWFMPNHIPAYKAGDVIVSGEHRLEMVRLAIQNIPYCKVSDFELKREGNTYTIDTLKLLKQQYPEHTFYFIMGADSLFCFNKWRNYEEIPEYAVLLVAPRDEKSKAHVISKIQAYNDYFGKICFRLIDCKEIPCSSSEIRESFQIEKKDLRNKYGGSCSFLSQSVYDYILSRELYM